MTDTKPWKYCYWMDVEHLDQVKQQMADRGIEPVQAKQNSCEVLREEIGYAEPAVWSVICRHDAAPWYNASKFAGKYLVVASFPLEDFSEFLETTITPVSFDPPAMPDRAKQKELAEDPAYKSREPKDWGAFPAEMGEAIVQGLAKMHNAEPEQFEDLLETWTAVHANFAVPLYRAGNDYADAPYSIADSAHISSCCVELFNLLDSPEKALLVRPCIGAVIVQPLERDTYYLVHIIKNSRAA